jgi:hypothetical protein
MRAASCCMWNCSRKKKTSTTLEPGTFWEKCSLKETMTDMRRMLPCSHTHIMPVNFIPFIQCLKVQGSKLPSTPYAFVAANIFMICIIYEAVEESLNEVCMRLSKACTRPHSTWATLLSYYRLDACCNLLQGITILAVLQLISFASTMIWVHSCLRFRALQVSASLPTTPYNETERDMRNIIIQSWQERKVSHVLVVGKKIYIMQGTARNPPKQAAEEARNLKGRTLAQINSRLFELTGTLNLYHVLHLQVSRISAQSIEIEHKFLAVVHRTLALFR